MTKAERIRLIRNYFEEIDSIEGEIPCILWRHTKQRDVYLYSREDESLANHEIILVKSSTPKVDKALKNAVKHYFQTAEELTVLLNSLVISYGKPKNKTQKITNIRLPETNNEFKNGWQEDLRLPEDTGRLKDEPVKTQRFSANFIDSALPQQSDFSGHETVNFSHYYQPKPKEKNILPIVGLVCVFIFLVAALITNPSLEKHRLVVQRQVQSVINSSFTYGSNSENNIQNVSTSGGIQTELNVTSSIERANFFLFSLTKLSLPSDSEIIGFGMFGNVFVDEEELKLFSSQISEMPIANLDRQTNQSTSSSDVDEMKSTVIVAVMEKFFSDPISKDELTYKFVFHNRSERDLTSLRGEVVFSNSSGEILEVLPLIYDRALGKNEKAIYHVTQQISPTSNRAKKLVETELSDLIVDWEPTQIRYSDGTSLSM